MKNSHRRYLKITLVIIGIMIGIIIIDTIQARIFKNSPIISFRDKLEDNDSYVDKGILIDTYYCTREKDIVTISYHFKGDKFTCPIDNVNEYSERAQNLVNLLKDKMIEMEILDENNLKMFEVLEIVEWGYYKDSTNKKHINFSFNYSCKDGSDNCLPEVFKKYGYKYDNNQASITAYTDEIEIFKLEHFAININDNYKQTDIIIY